MEEDKYKVDFDSENTPCEESKIDGKIVTEHNFQSNGNESNNLNGNMKINDEMNNVSYIKANIVQSEHDLSEQPIFSRIPSSSTHINGNFANECNVSGLKLTFKRSPTLGKKTKNYYDSLKKIGKMYLSDEDGIGDDMSTNGREEDERNYCSETELDTLWNQSDSIEADQYKMDPEADQMKESINGIFPLPTRMNDKSSPIETSSTKTGDEDIEVSLHLDSSSTSSSHFHSSTPTVTQTHQEQTPILKAQTETGKHPTFYNHPAIADSLEFIFDRKLMIPSSAQNHRHTGNICSNAKKIDVPSNFGRSESCVFENQPDLGLKEFIPLPDISRNSLKIDNQHPPSIDMGFESIEHQLHKILQLSNKHLPERKFYDESTNRCYSNFGHQPVSTDQHDESFFSRCKELLPFSHKYLLEQFIDEDLNRADVSSLMAENKVLQTSLDEQIFRRKHCEKQLGLLNTKVLELQQTIAVAMSVDKMKDDSIRGIDEMISRNVERWRRREEEQQTTMDKIAMENKSLKSNMKKQQTAILKCESHIEDLTNRLRGEKERSEKEIKELNRQLLHARDDLTTSEEQKTAELISMRKILEEERSSRSNLERELHDKISKVQTMFDDEQLRWKSKELKLMEEMKTLQNDGSERLELEKMRSDKLQNIIEDLNVSVKQSKKQMSTMEDEIRKLKMEKERLENALKSQESNFMDQLGILQTELAIKSRNEVTELTQKLVEMHKWDVEELMRSHLEEVESVRKESDEKCSQAVSTLSEALDDMHRLKEENDTLRSFRKEAAAKMQLMLRMHQEETLKLFGIDDSNGRPENFPSSDLLSGTNQDSSLGYLDGESVGDYKQPVKQSCVREKDEGMKHLEPFSARSKAKNMFTVAPKLGDKGYQFKNKDFEQNKKFKTVKYTPNKPENNSRKYFEGFSSDSLIPKNHKDNQAIPPTRLDKHAKDVPTNDNRKETADNSERSNVLKQYIKMMLQESTSTLSKVDQSSSTQKENPTYPG